jgi:hypothetical protein
VRRFPFHPPPRAPLPRFADGNSQVAVGFCGYLVVFAAIPIKPLGNIELEFEGNDLKFIRRAAATSAIVNDDASPLTQQTMPDDHAADGARPSLDCGILQHVCVISASSN